MRADKLAEIAEKIADKINAALRVEIPALTTLDFVSRSWITELLDAYLPDEADTPRATPNLDPERARMAFAYEPESLSVGRLNRAVRDLREEIYHLRLRLQAAEPVADEADTPREGCPCVDPCHRGKECVARGAWGICLSCRERVHTPEQAGQRGEQAPCKHWPAEPVSDELNETRKS